MNHINFFLDQLLEQINNVGIDVSNLKIDHIAYSTSSSKEYEKLLIEYLKEGELVKEAIISNRRVAIIKLKQAVKYKGSSINVMEIIEPIENQTSFSGWEHAEFLVDSYDKILQKYPNLSWNTAHKDRKNFSRIKLTLPNGMEVKFLNTPVLVSAQIEE